MMERPTGPGFAPSEEVIAEVARRTPTVMLSFSCGKDSVATWLAIKDHFPVIVPYYLYLVPGLAFIEEQLAYFEGVLGRRIVRLPNPSLYRMLDSLMFQPPQRVRTLQAMELPDITHQDTERWLCESLGIDYQAVYFASGVRASDSTIRALHFKRHGAITESRRMFYPVWDWNKQRVIDAIRASGIRLPIDYQLFGRSFDGINLQYLLAIKQHLPEDYARILEWFPLADLELFRLECAERARAGYPEPTE